MMAGDGLIAALVVVISGEIRDGVRILRMCFVQGSSRPAGKG